MKKIEISAKYELVTPLFMAGANQTAEFRLESYARVLRNMWRFLALGHLKDENVAFLWEAILFGWHAKPFGQGCIRFHLDEKPEEGLRQDWQNWNSTPGLNYLSAQGFKYREPARIKSFKIRLVVRDRNLGAFNDADCLWQKSIDILKKAIKALGLIGGMGSRTRRGYGSLMITEFDGDDTRFTDIQKYKTAIRSVLDCPFDGKLRYEVLSRQTMIDVCASGSNPEELMNEIGFAFQVFRSWGQSNNGGGHVHAFERDKTVPGGSAKENVDFDSTKNDHNNFYKHYWEPNRIDNRAVFGLPHNYGNVSVGLSGENKPVRRASGLQFHFHRIGKEVVFVQTVVQSQFKPDGNRIRVFERTRSKDLNDPPINWWEYPAKFRDFVRNPWPEVCDDKNHLKYTNYKNVDESVLPHAVTTT